MKKLNSFLGLLISCWCLAQAFTGNLKPVTKDGLTKIVATPELRSALQNNWAYFRILDSKKNEVPFFINSRQDAGDKITVKNLKIVSKSSIPNVSTSIIIANENELNLDNLNLTISNTEVVKTYSISGSDDQNQWYGLINSETISDLQSSTSTQVEKNFRFPLNKYKYLRFEFVDKKSLPVQVLAASLKNSQMVQNNALVELKDFQQKITQDKNAKTTVINLEFKADQVIDGIQFYISEPQFYLRNAQIKLNKTRVTKRRTQTYLETVASFDLNSKTQNQFLITELFERNIRIEIANQDNSPLIIDNIKLFQKPVTLISDLKASENYTIIVDSTLSVPQYDLSYFETNVNNTLSETTITNLTESTSNTSPQAEDSFWKSAAFMWICIGLALVVIAYFSMGLLKDLGKNESQ